MQTGIIQKISFSQQTPQSNPSLNGDAVSSVAQKALQWIKFLFSSIAALALAPFHLIANLTGFGHAPNKTASSSFSSVPSFNQETLLYAALASVTLFATLYAVSLYSSTTLPAIENAAQPLASPFIPTIPNQPIAESTPWLSPYMLLALGVGALCACKTSNACSTTASEKTIAPAKTTEKSTTEPNPIKYAYEELSSLLEKKTATTSKSLVNKLNTFLQKELKTSSLPVYKHTEIDELRLQDVMEFVNACTKIMHDQKCSPEEQQTLWENAFKHAQSPEKSEIEQQVAPASKEAATRLQQQQRPRHKKLLGVIANWGQTMRTAHDVKWEAVIQPWIRDKENSISIRVPKTLSKDEEALLNYIARHYPKNSDEGLEFDFEGEIMPIDSSLIETNLQKRHQAHLKAIENALQERINQLAKQDPERQSHILRITTEDSLYASLKGMLQASSSSQSSMLPESRGSMIINEDISDSDTEEEPQKTGPTSQNVVIVRGKQPRRPIPSWRLTLSQEGTSGPIVINADRLQKLLKDAENKLSPTHEKKFSTPATSTPPQTVHVREGFEKLKAEKLAEILTELANQKETGPSNSLPATYTISENDSVYSQASDLVGESGSVYGTFNMADYEKESNVLEAMDREGGELQTYDVPEGAKVRAKQPRPSLFGVQFANSKGLVGLTITRNSKGSLTLTFTKPAEES